MRRLVVSMALGLAVAAGSGRTVQAGDADSPATAESLLAAYTTRSQLDQRLGSKTTACADVGSGREICTWAFGNRSPAWRGLARAIGSDDRLNVVCELPADGGTRQADSCSVHPRRSNRYDWKPMRKGSKKAMAVLRDLPPRAQRQARAAALLDAARTPLELSRLVGEGPSECAAAGELRRCTWYTTAQTEGHGTLMMLIDASPREKVRLQCDFPRDGGSRAADSCSVEVGARRSR